MRITLTEFGFSDLLETLEVSNSIFVGVDFEHLRKCSGKIVKLCKFKTHIEEPLFSRKINYNLDVERGLQAV